MAPFLQFSLEDEDEETVVIIMEINGTKLKDTKAGPSL